MPEVLFLSNNDNSKELYEWIRTKTSVEFFSDKLNVEVLQEMNPRLVISYNYKYLIPKDCINFMNKRIINMHISYLPWNRGASPNIWSFIEDSPKGVTIHEMSPGLDEGDIIYQKEVAMDWETETLSSSYEKLNTEIVNLVKEHWEDLFLGNYVPVKQCGEGSYHTMKNLREFEEKVPFQWSDRVADFMEKVARQADKA